MTNKKESIIIKYLSKSKGYVTANELANLLDVSTKTITRSISSLNKFLKKYSVEIVSYRGLGYEMCGNKENISKVVQMAQDCIDGIGEDDGTENRISSAISLLINRDYISIDKISEELNLSQASISKLFLKVKEVVIKYDLNIKSKPCYGSYIVGDEKKIRLLIMDHSIKISENRNVQVKLDNIKNEEIKEIEKIIVKHLKENNMIMSDKDFDLLLAKFIISVSRIRKKSKIDTDYKTKDDSYIFIEKIMKEISNFLNITVEESEIYYILNYSGTILHSYSQGNNKEEIDYKISEIVMSSLEEIYIISGNDYRKDEEFLKAIYDHTKRMLSRVLENVRIDNPLMNQIKDNLPIELNLAVFLGKRLEEEFNIKIKENELAYIAVHFAVSTEKMKKEKVKNIAIVCHYGIGTGQLLAEKIRQNINDINIVGVYPLRYIDTVITKDIDLVVSTNPIKNINKQVVYVDNIFSDDVLKNIKNKLYEDNFREEIFKNMFNKDVFFKLNVGSRDELIKIVSKKMKDKGYISKEAINKIVEREQISSTELGNLVAIPHTIMDENKKSIISVTILDKPILWNKKEVQIVFMIFFSKEEKENAPVFRQLYNFVKDEEKVKRSIKVSKFDEFIGMLS